MKKNLIGATVAGLLLFLWQTLSWTVLQIHAAEYQKSANQDSVMNLLTTQFKTTGQYIIPHSDDTDMESSQKSMEAMKGKPWAVVSYHESYTTNMGANILRGMLTSILLMILVFWVITQNPKPTFAYGLISCLFIGLAGYLYIPYSLHIWYQTPDAGTNLLDTLAGWGLSGLWTGWWISRK